MMPDMDGTDVAEKLLLDPRTKNIPIICESACNNDPPISKIGIQN
jgi:CheY-like chemotaxis protein